MSLNEKNEQRKNELEEIAKMMEKVLTHCPVITNFNGASPVKPKVQIRE